MSTPDHAGAAPVLTPDKARAFLNRDAVNLAARLNKGGTLSASERKHLESIASGGAGNEPSFVGSIVELAAILKVERKTLLRWRKLKGAPSPRPDGRWDVAAWKAFKATRPAGNRAEETDSLDEKARQVRLQNEKLEAQVAILKRDYVPRADVEQWVSGMILTAKGVLLGLPSALAPQVVGLSIAEAESLIRDGINEALGQLHGDPLQGIADLASAPGDEEGEG